MGETITAVHIRDAEHDAQAFGFFLAALFQDMDSIEQLFDERHIDGLDHDPPNAQVIRDLRGQLEQYGQVMLGRLDPGPVVVPDDDDGA